MVYGFNPDPGLSVSLLVIQVDPKVSYFLTGLLQFSVYLLLGCFRWVGKFQWETKGVPPSLGPHLVTVCPCISPPVFSPCVKLGGERFCGVDLPPLHCVSDVSTALMPSRSKVRRCAQRATAASQKLQQAKQAGTPRKTLRLLARSLAFKRKQWHKARSKRCFYILTQRHKTLRSIHTRQRAWKHGITFATWNTRGLGAREGQYPAVVKVKCFFHRMIEQNWGCIACTDLKGPEGTREFKALGRTWTLITRGRVGFLLDDVWADWWRQGGSVTYASGDRVCGIQFPRQGWRRGLYVVSVYAPTSDATVTDRQCLRDQVTEVLHMSQPTSIQVVIGDFNAELGNNSDAHQPGNAVLGPFGASRVTVAGMEWRRWAEREGLIHCHI